MGRTKVAGGGRARRGLAHHAHGAASAPRGRGGPIGRAVVDHDYLVVGVEILAGERRERAGQRRLRVAGRDDYACLRDHLDHLAA